MNLFKDLLAVANEVDDETEIEMAKHALTFGIACLWRQDVSVQDICTYVTGVLNYVTENLPRSEEG